MIPLADINQVIVIDPERRSGSEGSIYLIKQAMEESGGFAFPARRKETA